MGTRRSKYLKPNGPTSRLSGDCAVDGCDRPPFRKGWCNAHFKRWQRKKTVGGLIGVAAVPGGLALGEELSPEECVVVMGSAMLEADSEDDQAYRLKRRRFLKAAMRWVESLGWAPPDRVRKPRRA